MSRSLPCRLLPLVALGAVAVATTAFAPLRDPASAHPLSGLHARFGPPWIGIEYPPSPYDRVTREALLLVRAYHHFTPTGLPVSGTAEGIVKGARRTVKLTFEPTSREGAYALRRQWPVEGTWVLNIQVTQGAEDGNTAGALVRLSADGEVAGVTVPTRHILGYDTKVPRRVTSAEVEWALRTK